jgi:hypothetical protein
MNRPRIAFQLCALVSLFLGTASVRADPLVDGGAVQRPNDRRYGCQPGQNLEQVICRRCADEARTTERASPDAKASAMSECKARAALDWQNCTHRPGATNNEMAACDVASASAEDACEKTQRRVQIDERTAFDACRTRTTKETEELKTLVGKFSNWQPRGYQGAGDGIEALTDAELDALIPTARAALQRENEIAVDLGQASLPTDKAEQAITELQGFQTKERACRADKKCMAARAAKKAEEQFYANVVAPMCMADKEREQAQADIANERANPSGVVDMNVLHEAGAAVQASQKTITDFTPEYVKTRHHGWRGWKTECQ